MTDNTQAPAPAEPPVPASVAPKKRRWITPTLALVATLAVGIVGGVLIGHGTAASASPSGFSRGQFGGAGGGTGGGTGTGGFGGAAGGGFVSGTIVSVDGTKIVVKAADGTQKTITTDTSTTVTKTEKSSTSELKKGQTITVVGTADSSGDVTARNISEGQLRGGFGGRGAGGGAGGTGNSGGTGTGTGTGN